MFVAQHSPLRLVQDLDAEARRAEAELAAPAAEGSASALISRLVTGGATAAAPTTTAADTGAAATEAAAVEEGEGDTAAITSPTANGDVADSAASGSAGMSLPLQLLAASAAARGSRLGAGTPPPGGSGATSTTASASAAVVSPEHLLRAFPGLDTRAQALRTIAQVLLHSRHPQLGAAATDPGLLLLVLRQKGILAPAADSSLLAALNGLLLTEPRFFRLVPLAGGGGAADGAAAGAGAGAVVAVQLRVDQLLELVPPEGAATEGGAADIAGAQSSGGNAQLAGGAAEAVMAAQVAEAAAAGAAAVAKMMYLEAARNSGSGLAKPPGAQAGQPDRPQAGTAGKGGAVEGEPSSGSAEAEGEEEASDEAQLATLMRLLDTGARLERPLPESAAQLAELSPLLAAAAAAAKQAAAAGNVPGEVEASAEAAAAAVPDAAPTAAEDTGASAAPVEEVWPPVPEPEAPAPTAAAAPATAAATDGPAPSASSSAAAASAAAAAAAGSSPTAAHLQPAVVRYISGLDVAAGAADEVAALAAMRQHCAAAGRVVVDCAVADLEMEPAIPIASATSTATAAPCPVPTLAAIAGAAAAHTAAQAAAPDPDPATAEGEAGAEGAGGGAVGSVGSTAAATEANVADAGVEAAAAVPDGAEVAEAAGGDGAMAREDSGMPSTEEEPAQANQGQAQHPEAPSGPAASVLPGAAGAGGRDVPVLLAVLAPAAQCWPTTLYVLGVAGLAPGSAVLAAAAELLEAAAAVKVMWSARQVRGGPR